VKGYVAKKGDRWYAVIYEGLDPVTGKERRSWHPAGTSREEAERLAARLAKELNGRNAEGRSLSFGAYLTTRWLPGKKLKLARSTWDGYRRKIDRHILPTLGKVSIQRLRPHHLEALYDQKLHPTEGWTSPPSKMLTDRWPICSMELSARRRCSENIGFYVDGNPPRRLVQPSYAVRDSSDERCRCVMLGPSR
jgi:hypothetical protein